jgi:hypothetical protein
MNGKPSKVGGASCSAGGERKGQERDQHEHTPFPGNILTLHGAAFHERGKRGAMITGFRRRGETQGKRLPRGSATRQSTHPFHRAIAQITADGLPRGCAPRNDEGLEVWDVSVGGRFVVADGAKGRASPSHGAAGSRPHFAVILRSGAKRRGNPPAFICVMPFPPPPASLSPAGRAGRGSVAVRRTPWQG